MNRGIEVREELKIMIAKSGDDGEIKVKRLLKGIMITLIHTTTHIHIHTYIEANQVKRKFQQIQPLINRLSEPLTVDGFVKQG